VTVVILGELDLEVEDNKIMDVFKKLDRILEKTKLKEAKSSHSRRQHTSHQDRPGIGASTRYDKLQKARGPGPMATSYHGNTRVNPKTGKKEVYDQAKGWISAEEKKPAR